MRDGVIAIVASDIHLSHTPPLARSIEPDWYAAMKRSLEQLRKLQGRYGMVPIIYAGDIFDKWNSPPELINFAITNLPKGHAIPGQHDLPNHSYDQIKRSAYWTLVEAGAIWNLEPGEYTKIDAFDAVGFPWGFEVRPNKGPSDVICLAVVHSYIWYKKASYLNAPPDSKAPRWVTKLRGYDAAVFGDNHKGFEYQNIFNSGTFFRRTIDERGYRPRVGLLTDRGEIKSEYLSTNDELFIDEREVKEMEQEVHINADEFLSELSDLGRSVVDFSEALMHWMEREKTPSSVKSLILKALEK